MTPRTTIAEATKVWQSNTFWPLHSQCAVWDPERKCVFIFECLRDHIASPGTEPPRNSTYWRFIARR